MSIPVNKRLYHLNGLSTDTKPIPSDISTGSTFLETDTGTTYVFSRATETWKPLEDETSGGAVDAVCIGIVSIDKIKTEGLVDTYAIKYTNGASTTFTVTNGTFIEPNTTQEEETLIPNKLYTLDIDTNTYNIHDLFNIDSDVLEDGSLESAVIDHTKYWPRLTDGKFVLNVPEKSFSTVFEFVNTNEEGQDIWQAFVLDEENSFVRYVGHFEYVNDHNRDSSDYYFVAKPQTIKEVDNLETDLADTKALLEETRAELVVESQRATTKEDELQEAVDNLEFNKDRLFTELNQEVSRAVIVEQTIKADLERDLDEEVQRATTRENELDALKAERTNPEQVILAGEFIVDNDEIDDDRLTVNVEQGEENVETNVDVHTLEANVRIRRNLTTEIGNESLSNANVDTIIHGGKTTVVETVIEAENENEEDTRLSVSETIENGNITEVLTGAKSIDAGAIETSSDTLNVDTNELDIEATTYGRVYTATDENDNHSLNIKADNDLNVNLENTINVTARNSNSNLGQINVDTAIYNSQIGAKSEQLGMSSKSIETSETIVNLGNKSETIDGETIYRFEKQEATQEAEEAADVYTANIAISNNEAIVTVNGDTTFSTDTLEVGANEIRITSPVISTEGDITSEGNITNTGNIANQGNLTNDGNVEINNGTLEVEGKTTLENDLEVQQNTALQGTLNVTGATELSATLDVAEKATFDKAVEIKGTTTSNGITNTGAIANTGNITNSGTLENTGKATLKDDLDVKKNTILEGTLEVQGRTTTTGITNTGTLDNTGNVTIHNATQTGAEVTTTINENGVVIENGNLRIVGHAFVAGGTQASQFSQIDSTKSNVFEGRIVAGYRMAAGTNGLEVANNAQVDGNTRLEGTLTVDNKILADDSKVNITKPTNITGNTNITGTLHTTDVATFDTNIIIKGSKITKQTTGQNDKDYTLPDETGTLALVSQVNTAETAAKAYTDAEIRDLDANLGDGTKLISTITETDGKLSAYDGPTILNTVTATDNIPTSNAVKTYADNINTDLQNQINNLKSVQNVVEVVGTKAALNALTKTDYDAGDKVQVIADESLTDSPTSVYELNAARNAWDYVGAYGGNSYTKTESDARFVNKNIEVNGHALTGNITVTKADVNLGNVDNKSATTLKSEFTGAIQANNTGFVIGNDVYNHTSNTNNPHAVTKAQVGLGNVANLAPADLPVSTAQQTALDEKVDKVTGYGLSKNDFSDNYKSILDNAYISVDYDTTNHILYKTTPAGAVDNIVSAVTLRDDAGFRTTFQSTPDDNHFVSEKLVKDSLDDLEDYVDTSIETASEITDSDYTDIENAFQAALNPSVEE